MYLLTVKEESIFAHYINKRTKNSAEIHYNSDLLHGKWLHFLVFF